MGEIIGVMMPRGVYTRSEETKRKISEGKKNPSQETRRKLSESRMGKGQKPDNEITRRTLHRWVESRMPKPDICPMCQQQKEYMELHNIWGTYRRIISVHEWVWLCRKCHNHVEVHKRYHPQIRRNPIDKKATGGSFKKGHPYHPRHSHKDE